MAHPKLFLVTADIISGAAIAGAMMQWLPPIAALGGVIWYAIQIWESKTVQKWVKLHRRRQRVERLVQATLAAHRVRDLETANGNPNPS